MPREIGGDMSLLPRWTALVTQCNCRFEYASYVHVMCKSTSCTATLLCCFGSKAPERVGQWPDVLMPIPPNFPRLHTSTPPHTLSSCLLSSSLPLTPPLSHASAPPCRSRRPTSLATHAGARRYVFAPVRKRWLSDTQGTMCAGRDSPQRIAVCRVHQDSRQLHL